MHIPGAELLMAKLFGGVKTEMRMSQKDLEAVTPLIKSAEKQVALKAFLCLVLLCATGLSLILVQYSLLGEAKNPVLDEFLRWQILVAFVWLIGSLCTTGLVVAPYMTRRQLRIVHGQPNLLYDSYYATKQGWRLRRLAVFALFFQIMIGITGYVVLAGSRRLDENGFTTGDLAIHKFTDVVAIESYARIDAPIGMRLVPTLIVRFVRGSSFEYSKEPKHRGPAVSTIAQYISVRSGIPITFRDVRPK